MLKVQKDVEEFHKALEVPVGNSPEIRRGDLRIELIREEYKELKKAIEKDDLAAAIDGMCDLIYVVAGSAVEFGIDLEPFWDEVQKTNMAKVGGKTRFDGKKLKPDGWVKPDIEGILAEIENSYHES